jgi:hypothetical protein
LDKYLSQKRTAYYLRNMSTDFKPLTRVDMHMRHQLHAHVAPHLGLRQSSQRERACASKFNPYPLLTVKSRPSALGLKDTKSRPTVHGTCDITTQGSTELYHSHTTFTVSSHHRPWTSHTSVHRLSPIATSWISLPTGFNIPESTRTQSEAL